MAFGVTPAGFVGKPLTTVESEIDTALKGILGESAGSEPDGTIPLKSMAGQLKVVLTDGFAAQWDLQQAVYSSFDPNSATADSLDAVASITGTLRDAATFSSLTGTMTGSPGTVIPQGSVASVQVSGTRFDTFVPLTLVAVPAWTGSTSYFVGNRVANNNRVYQCTLEGLSAASGGPTGTGQAIVDLFVTWEYLGEGTAAGDVLMKAEASGPFDAVVKTLTVIATPVGGWSNVTNLTLTTIGSNLETDAHLRARREGELAADGKSTADAIRAAILKVNEGSTDPTHLPISNVTVFHNDTDTTDGNGVPPHSVEVLVQYAGNNVTTDKDIANAVFASVGAGIGMFGNQTSSVTDSQGNTQTVKWSKPTAVPIYIVATVYYDPTKWPVTGAAALVQQYALSALLTYTLNFPVGQSVRSAPLVAAILEGPSAVDSTGTRIVPAPAGSTFPPGLLDVSPLNIGTAPAPGTSTPITITSRQVATFSASNINITATAEAP